MMGCRRRRAVCSTVHTVRHYVGESTVHVLGGADLKVSGYLFKHEKAQADDFFCREHPELKANVPDATEHQTSNIKH